MDLVGFLVLRHEPVRVRVRLMYPIKVRFFSAKILFSGAGAVLDGLDELLDESREIHCKLGLIGGCYVLEQVDQQQEKRTQFS